jgi:hypothetical protein
MNAVGIRSKEEFARRLYEIADMCELTPAERIFIMGALLTIK